MGLFDKITSGTFSTVQNFTTIQNLKKELEEKNKERAKIYGYIGMEVCDLHTQKKIQIPELDVYFEKMDMLKTEIEELEKQKIQLEKQNKGSVCSCGYAIPANSKFCPSCGKPVEPDVILCDCGKTIQGDMAFCPQCGKNLKQIGMNQTGTVAGTNSENYKVCICGAKVAEGQFMCMECGRKLE